MCHVTQHCIIVASANRFCTLLVFREGLAVLGDVDSAVTSMSHILLCTVFRSFQSRDALLAIEPDHCGCLELPAAMFTFQSMLRVFFTSVDPMCSFYDCLCLPCVRVVQSSYHLTSSADTP